MATIGDFIIKGVHGEPYPCKPDIFAKTYEEVSGTWQRVRPDKPMLAGQINDGIQFIIREINDSLSEMDSYIKSLSSKNNNVTIKRNDVIPFFRYKETLIRHKTRLERLLD